MRMCAVVANFSIENQLLRILCINFLGILQPYIRILGIIAHVFKRSYTGNLANHHSKTVVGAGQHVRI
jgi:hypothetical protein